MKKTLLYFLKGKNNVNYYNNVVNGLVTIIFIFITTELVLWVSLSQVVSDKGHLALMIFGFCNFMLFSGSFFYYWTCRNYGKDIENLLPSINRYHRNYFSFQDEILVDYVLAQLLKGKYPPENYEEYFSNNTTYDFINSEYRVVVIIPENEYDNNAEAFRVCSLALNDIAKDSLSVYMLEIDSMLVGICFPKHRKSFVVNTNWLEMTRFFQYVQVKVEENTDVHLNIAAGGRHKGLAALAKAFNEAMSAHKYREIYGDENCLVFYNNINFPEQPDASVYEDDVWYESERKLLYAVNNGDYEAGEEIIDEMCAMMSNISNQTFQLMKYKAFGLINTLTIELMKKRTLDNELMNINGCFHISQCKSVHELTRSIRIIYKAIETELKSQESEISANTNRRVSEIMAYIRENYTNTDLNIVYVAEKFNLTPAYLSRIFKKETGVGPAEYLQTIRLEAAKELLTSSDLTIREISEIVGYQYVLTMNRVFKKMLGVTPSQYIAENKKDT